MEQHLSRIAANVGKYKARMEIIEQTHKEVRAQEREENNKHSAFRNKLKEIRTPLAAYRDAISPILDKAVIDVRIETWEHSSIILSKTHRPKDLILFAIAHKKSTELIRWRHCGFLAIWGDYINHEVHIYEYSDQIDRENDKNNRIMRNEFPKNCRQIHKISIDQLDFDMLLPTITSYLSKELDYLMNRYNPDQIMQSINSTSWKNYQKK